MTRNAAEHRLSHYVDSLLDRIVTEPCWYTAIDHSGEAIGGDPTKQMHWRQKQKAYGIKPSHLDWYVYQVRTGVFTQIELKYGDNEPTVGQDTTMRLLTERGIPTACCWTIIEVYNALVAAGFVLHGNAANIAIEIEARWRAADDAADRPAKKRSAGRKAAPRYSANAGFFARASKAGVML